MKMLTLNRLVCSLGFWLVTVAALTLNAAETLYPDTVTPAARLSDAPNWELGTVFRAAVPGKITHVRVFSLVEESGDHQIRIWHNSDNTLVAGPITWSFGGEEAWITFDIPDVTLQPNEDYTVSISSPAEGWYPANAAYFASAGNNGQHLSYPQGAGVFSDTLGTRPTGINNGAYLRDIVFEPDLSGAVMKVKGNSTDIADGDLTPSPSDDTQFGGVDVTTGARDHTFTISNTGQANLDLSGNPKVALSGANAGDFTVTTQPTSPVPPGGSTTFTLRLVPSGPGLRDAMVSITHSASPGNAYDFAVQGVGLAAGNRVLGNNSEGTSVQLINGDYLNGNRSQALRNLRITALQAKVAGQVGNFKCAVYSDADGSADRLLGSTAEVMNTTAGWLTFTLTQPLDVVAGNFYWLVIWSDTGGAGVYADPGTHRYAQYPYGDWPDPVSLTGTGGAALCLYAEGAPLGVTGPEMDVQGKGKPIADDATSPSQANGTDLGGRTFNSGTRLQTFTILNVGTASLALSGAPSATVVGPQSSDFVVTAQPAASVTAGGSTTFTITFTPSAVGVRRATVTIPHADSPANAYDFAIQGAGLDPGAGVLGNDGIGTDTRFIDRTDIQANRFMAPGDLRITELHAKVVAGAANFVCAVYSDNNGLADRLLGSSAPVADATNGWNTFPLTSPLNLTGGDFYWLAIWSDTPAAVLQEDGGAGRFYYGVYSYADLGGQWPDPIDLVPNMGEARTYCIYAEGTPLVQAPGATINLRGNGKLIVSGDTTPSGLDGTDFGSLAVGGSSPEQTFTIGNSGLAPLLLTNSPPVIVTEAQASDYQVTSPPTSPVPPGSSTTFTVRFSPSAGGFRAATISIPNNGVDPDKNPYQFKVQGAGQVTGRESLWPDSKVGADVSDDGVYYQLGTIFQSSVAGAVTHLRVFSVNGDYGNHTAYIWRTSDQAVVGGPYTWNFGHVTGWIYFDIPPVNIDAATDYTVSISTGTGPKRDYANIAADVPVAGDNGLHLSYPADAGVFNENLADTMPFKSWNHSSYLRDVVFVPAGSTATFPNLAVQGNNLLIPDGFSSPTGTNNTDFGPAAVGGGTADRTFVITNTGTAPLNLSATPKVAITSPQAGDFTVLAQPASPIPPGGSSELTIRFAPAATGARRALVSIENNDKNPFYFSIAGTGTAAQVRPRIVSLTPNLTTGDVTLGWQDGGPQFQVEKATTVTGQFQPLSPVQSERTFTDPGVLKTNTQNFYRVRQL